MARKLSFYCIYLLKIHHFITIIKWFFCVSISCGRSTLRVTHQSSPNMILILILPFEFDIMTSGVLNFGPVSQCTPTFSWKIHFNTICSRIGIESNRADNERCPNSVIWGVERMLNLVTISHLFLEHFEDSLKAHATEVNRFTWLQRETGGLDCILSSSGWNQILRLSLSP
jgi:hypothetical protein